MLVVGGVNKRALTHGLGDGHVGTQGTQGKRSLLPRGVTLLAHPEHLNHQKDPLEEDEKSDDQHGLLLGGPRSDADNGEDDGETSGPNGAVEESTDCDRCMSGRRNGDDRKGVSV